jgi:hypothetical protein
MKYSISKKECSVLKETKTLVPLSFYENRHLYLASLSWSSNWIILFSSSSDLFCSTFFIRSESSAVVAACRHIHGNAVEWYYSRIVPCMEMRPRTQGRYLNVVLFSEAMPQRLFNNTDTKASVSFFLKEPKQETFGYRFFCNPSQYG